MADLRQEPVGVGEVRVEIVAADLQIDRRRRAEIQNLADDIGRQKREGQAREAARQRFAQAINVTGGRRVPGLSEIWMSPSDSPIVPVLL